MTEEQLDARCEVYLESRFGVGIDFAIAQSLVSLIDDGVVRKDSQVRIPTCLLVPVKGHVTAGYETSLVYNM